MTARRSFKELYEDLLARVDHGGRAVSDPEQRELRARLEVWEREPSRALPGELLIPERPPRWERVATRLGLDALMEPPQAAEPQAADHENPPWPVQLIRDILDRAHEKKGRPTILEELKDKTYFNHRGATEYVVAKVLRLFKHDDDAPRRLEMALEMALEIAQVSSPARATVTLETLENAVVEPDSE